jgi:hypothetical protein
MGPSPGFTTAGAVTKTASNSTSPSRCFSSAAVERLGAGIENAWLDASKIVVSPPESSLVENTGVDSTATGDSESHALSRIDTKKVKDSKL